MLPCERTIRGFFSNCVALPGIDPVQVEALIKRCESQDTWFGYLCVDEVYPTVAMEMDNRGVLHGMPDVGDIEAYREILSRCIPKEVATFMKKPITSAKGQDTEVGEVGVDQLMKHLMQDLNSGKASVEDIIEIMDLHATDYLEKSEEEPSENPKKRQSPGTQPAGTKIANTQADGLFRANILAKGLEELEETTTAPDRMIFQAMWVSFDRKNRSPPLVSWSLIRSLRP
jgi:hypothetical protein